MVEYLLSRKAEKHNCLCICIHEEISTTLDFNICRRKPFEVYLIDVPKSEFTSVIFFVLDLESKELKMLN